MNPYLTELHQGLDALAHWLGSAEGDFAQLIDRFAADFSMTVPSGAQLDRNGLAAFLQAQQASRPGLNISVDRVSVLHQWDQGAVVHYRELQHWDGNGGNVRWATALFSVENEKVRWRHVQETLEA